MADLAEVMATLSALQQRAQDLAEDVLRLEIDADVGAVDPTLDEAFCLVGASAQLLTTRVAAARLRLAHHNEGRPVPPLTDGMVRHLLVVQHECARFDGHVRRSDNPLRCACCCAKLAPIPDSTDQEASRG